MDLNPEALAQEIADKMARSARAATNAQNSAFLANALGEAREQDAENDRIEAEWEPRNLDDVARMLAAPGDTPEYRRLMLWAERHVRETQKWRRVEAARTAAARLRASDMSALAVYALTGNSPYEGVNDASQAFLDDLRILHDALFPPATSPPPRKPQL